MTQDDYDVQNHRAARRPRGVYTLSSPPTSAKGSRVPSLPAGDQGTARESSRSSDHVHVQEYHAPNWFTTRGVLAKRRRIELRGMPSMKQWRFITLTIDPAGFDGPEEAFKAGRAKMRRWMEACRADGFWNASTPWCWKLEFHKNGWPHWHVLVGRTRKFSKADFVRIEELWGLGDVSHEMVRQDDFLYSFKYAFKPVRIDHSEADSHAWTVPDWFLDYVGMKFVKVAMPDGSTELMPKPETFQRVRFWQTSRNFYTGRKPPVPSDRKPQQSWGIPFPVRELAERAFATVQLIARDRLGTYSQSAVIRLDCSTAYLWHLAAWHAVGGNATFLRINSAVIPKHIITRNTQQLWQIQELLQINQLTHNRAVKLQRRGETLRRS